MSVPLALLLFASIANPWAPQVAEEPETVTLLVEEESTAISQSFRSAL